MTGPKLGRWVAASLVAIIVAGCTGASTTPSPAVATPIVTPALGTATPDPTPKVVSDAEIVIGASVSLSWVPLTFAIDNGYFEDAGLTNVSLTIIESASNTAVALAAGDIQFGGLALERAITATQGGKPTQCIVASSDLPPTTLVVSTALDIAPGDWGALRGKSIGVIPGGYAEIAPKYLLKQAGFDPNEVNWVSTPNPAAQFAGMKTGNIDGFAGTEPSPRQAIFEGFAKEFMSLQNDETRQVWPSPFLSACLQASADYAAANPEVMAAVKEAYVRSLKELHATPSLAVDVAVKLLPTQPRPLMEQAIGGLVRGWSKDGELPEAAVENVQNLLIEYGVLDQKLPYSQVVYTAP